MTDDIAIALGDPAAADALHCLAAYFAELAQRFPGGFDPGPPADPARYRPPQGAFLMATRADRGPFPLPQPGMERVPVLQRQPYAQVWFAKDL